MSFKVSLMPDVLGRVSAASDFHKRRNLFRPRATSRDFPLLENAAEERQRERGGGNGNERVYTRERASKWKKERQTRSWVSEPGKGVRARRGWRMEV